MTGWNQDPFGGRPFGADPVGGDATGGFHQGAPPVYATPPLAPHGTSGGGANTFATLSVIFAFVFAPAGAVLGHLGLHQIKRTGQPGRNLAITGLCLSYTIAVIAIVALVAWLTISSSETTEAAQSSTGPVTLPPPGEVEPPVATPGRNLSAVDLPNALLSVEEVTTMNDDLRDSLQGYEDRYGSQYSDRLPPVPNFVGQPPTTALVPSPGPQGSINPSECAPTMISGSEEGYRNTGVQAIYSTAMSGPSTFGEARVTQSILTFADPAAAQRALTRVLQRISSCMQYQPPGMHKDGIVSKKAGDFAFTAPEGGAEDWYTPTRRLEPYNGLYYDFDATRSEPEIPFVQGERPKYYKNDRGFAVKGNAVVDVSVKGTELDSSSGIVRQVLERMV